MVTEVLVSFILTVKNAEAFIIETIKSVLEQSIDNWELIVIDDGSTDSTIKIIKNFSKNDSRIKIIVTGGIGRGRALNLAIDNTKGEYLAIIDADDPSHPQRAEIQRKILNEHKEFAVVATNFLIINGNGSLDWDLYRIENLQLEVKDVTSNKDKPFRKEPINHSSVMFRKKDLLKVGKYDEKRTMQFDAELWNRLSFEGYKICLISIELASKRIHSKQSYEIGNRRRYLYSALKLNKSIVKKFKLSPTYYIYVYIKFFYGFLPKSIRRIIKTIS